MEANFGQNIVHTFDLYDVWISISSLKVGQITSGLILYGHTEGIYQ